MDEDSSFDAALLPAGTESPGTPRNGVKRERGLSKALSVLRTSTKFQLPKRGSSGQARFVAEVDVEEDNNLEDTSRRRGTTSTAPLNRISGRQRSAAAAPAEVQRRNAPRGDWSAAEEAVLAYKHMELGNKWTSISNFLPLRSDNDVKNIWHSTLRSKNIDRRSFLRNYARAVKDCASDAEARKQAYEMAQQLCGQPQPIDAALAAVQQEFQERLTLQEGQSDEVLEGGLSAEQQEGMEDAWELGSLMEDPAEPEPLLPLEQLPQARPSGGGSGANGALQQNGDSGDRGAPQSLVPKPSPPEAPARAPTPGPNLPDIAGVRAAPSPHPGLNALLRLPPPSAASTCSRSQTRRHPHVQGADATVLRSSAVRAAADADTSCLARLSGLRLADQQQRQQLQPHSQQEQQQQLQPQQEQLLQKQQLRQSQLLQRQASLQRQQLQQQQSQQEQHLQQQQQQQQQSLQQQQQPSMQQQQQLSMQQQHLLQQQQSLQQHQQFLAQQQQSLHQQLHSLQHQRMQLQQQSSQGLPADARNSQQAPFSQDSGGSHPPSATAFSLAHGSVNGPAPIDGSIPGGPQSQSHAQLALGPAPQPGSVGGAGGFCADADDLLALGLDLTPEELRLLAQGDPGAPPLTDSVFGPEKRGGGAAAAASAVAAAAEGTAPVRVRALQHSQHQQTHLQQFVASVQPASTPSSFLLPSQTQPFQQQPSGLTSLELPSSPLPQLTHASAGRVASLQSGPAAAAAYGVGLEQAQRQQRVQPQQREQPEPDPLEALLAELDQAPSNQLPEPLLCPSQGSGPGLSYPCVPSPLGGASTDRGSHLAPHSACACQQAPTGQHGLLSSSSTFDLLSTGPGPLRQPVPSGGGAFTAGHSSLCSGHLATSTSSQRQGFVPGGALPPALCAPQFGPAVGTSHTSSSRPWNMSLLGPGGSQGNARTLSSPAPFCCDAAQLQQLQQLQHQRSLQFGHGPSSGGLSLSGFAAPSPPQMLVSGGGGSGLMRPGSAVTPQMASLAQPANVDVVTMGLDSGDLLDSMDFTEGPPVEPGLAGELPSLPGPARMGPTLPAPLQLSQPAPAPTPFNGLSFTSSVSQGGAGRMQGPPPCWPAGMPEEAGRRKIRPVLQF